MKRYTIKAFGKDVMEAVEYEQGEWVKAEDAKNIFNVGFERGQEEGARVGYHEAIDEIERLKAEIESLEAKIGRLSHENISMKSKIQLAIDLIEHVRNVTHIIYPEDSKTILERLKK